MREIKFRGKTRSGSRWLYGSLISQGRMCMIATTTYEQMDVIPETVGQYTGLKDKNGNEIYEGDIVRMHYFFENHNPHNIGVVEDEKEIIGVVKIDEMGVYIEKKIKYYKVKYYCLMYLEMPNEQLEVIGNIYENGDLLK